MWAYIVDKTADENESRQIEPETFHELPFVGNKKIGSDDVQELSLVLVVRFKLKVYFAVTYSSSSPETYSQRMQDLSFFLRKKGNEYAKVGLLYKIFLYYLVNYNSDLKIYV